MTTYNSNLNLISLFKTLSLLTKLGEKGMVTMAMT